MHPLVRFLDGYCCFADKNADSRLQNSTAPQSSSGMAVLSLCGSSKVY